jgi:hypothetical protein
MSQPHEPTEPTPPTPQEAHAEAHAAPPPDTPAAAERSAAPPEPPAAGEPAEPPAGEAAAPAGPPPGRPGVPAYGPYVPVGAPQGRPFGPAFGRFARNRATQVVAAMVVGAVIGGGTVAIVDNLATRSTQESGPQSSQPGPDAGPFGRGGQGYRQWYGTPFGGGQGSGG